MQHIRMRMTERLLQVQEKQSVWNQKAGVYPVEYSYTAEGSPTAVTKLFVVVQDQEGTQDGK